MNQLKLVLFGTGNMGLEYAKVLKSLGYDFLVVGRGQRSATNFYKKTGITPFIGGANKFLAESSSTVIQAIVAVTGDELGNVTLELLKHGTKYILVEKPGGLNEREIRRVNNEAKKHSASVFIAYNRRFYSSVEKANEIIKREGGVISFHFEFNEPGEKIPLMEDSGGVQKEWLLHNSSHVIDLAFFLGGTPKSMISKTTGFLIWNPYGAIFTGCGLSQQETPFTYHANWLSPGRWNLEFMTKNYRLLFQPLEELHIQKKGSFKILKLNLRNNHDTNFKPGLYKEVLSFLGNKENLCTINQQLNNLRWYTNISQGKTI